MDQGKFHLLVTFLLLYTLDFTFDKTVAESSDKIQNHDLIRVIRQADVKMKNHGNFSSNSSMDGRAVVESKAEHDFKAKGAASGGFDLGIGLSGLSLTGTGDATGEVESEGKISGKGQSEGNAKSRSGGLLGSMFGGGLFFPSIFGKYAPEDNSLREKREIHRRFKRQLDAKGKVKSQLEGEVASHGSGMIEGNGQHEARAKGGVSGGFGLGLGLSGLSLTGTADATGEVDSKGSLGSKARADGGVEGKSKGLFETMFGTGFIFGKRRKRDAGLYTVQFLDTCFNNTLSIDNIGNEIQNEILWKYKKKSKLIPPIAGENKDSYSNVKDFYKIDKANPDQIDALVSMGGKNRNRIARQVETDEFTSRLGQYNLQPWQIHEMLKEAPPERREKILQNYAPEILDINPDYLNRYKNI